MNDKDKILKLSLENSNYFRMLINFTEKNELLEAENKKLRECLEATLKAAEYMYKPDRVLKEHMEPIYYFTLSYDGDVELIEKTKEARELLKTAR